MTSDPAERLRPHGDAAADALAAVVAGLPGGGEARPGQVAMARAVADAIATERHLVVQAGTGTGKSLAYLVPALLSGRKVVVTTATTALQDQLAGKDLPFLARRLDRPFSWAVLKGRSNYLCRQRLEEAVADDRLGLDVDDLGPGVRAEIQRLAAWADPPPGTQGARLGDRAELTWEPTARTWAAVSVSAQECPGASRCPAGERCFAEAARARAAAADVVVTNTHLYGLHVASGGYLLPEHDVVVIDEAHQLEDTVSATSGIELGPGRFGALARAVDRVVADNALVADLAGAASTWRAALAPHARRRLRRPIPDALAEVIAALRGRVERAGAALGGVDAAASPEVGARKLRAQKAVLGLTDDLDRVLELGEDDVAWVELVGREAVEVLKVAPVDVGRLLRDALWPHVTAVLTSATLPPGLPARVGMDPGDHVVADVGSPFDHQGNALLYCARHLPDPRSATFDRAAHDELAGLIEAAGGRTLALFTSWRAMAAAVEALRPRLDVPVLAQGDRPKPALVEAFRSHEPTCLFATMGFWQGVDVPGPTLSLVAIDRLPFPRPDDPLLQARRERAGADAFRVVDVPRAATLLAQAAGRLVRRADDRGVVAVLDRRLATAPYRWDLVRALPPMRRTREPAEVRAFLRELSARAA